VIGHGSGKLDPKLTEQPSYYLKEYYATLEEGRADLVALWNIFDPKLKELGLVSSDEVGRAMYDSAARVMVTQLAKIPRGDTIEEDHQRDRQLIARYVMDKTGSIVVEKVRTSKEKNFGYNAQTAEYGDLVEMGVIDPTKVVRFALQNAASVAGLVLTTAAMVAELVEEKTDGAASRMGGGMGGMEM